MVKRKAVLEEGNLPSALAARFGRSYIAGDVPKLERLDTGIIGIDRMLGGGIPVGRVMQVVSAASGGKTTLSLQMIASLQRQGYECGYVDLERTVSSQRLDELGVSRDKLHLIRPDSGTEGLEFAIECANLGCKFVVIDSVPFLLPRPRPGEETEVGQVMMAPVARLLSQAQHLLVPAFEHNNSTLLLINQRRNTLTSYGKPTQEAGGNALRYMCSIIIEMTRKEVYKEGHGVRMQLKTVKNKTYKEGVVTEIDLLFESGFDIYSSMVETLLEEKFVTKSGTWYDFASHITSEFNIPVERIGQGSKSVVEALRSNDNLYKQLYDKVKNADSALVIDDTINDEEG